MADCDLKCEGCSKKDNCNIINKIEVNKKSKIRKIIAVGSGKGGVGKSLVTSLLAVKLRKEGYKVGILDADITGPSIPTIFGITSPALEEEGHIIPVKSSSGIKIVSINMFLENADDPVILRGPILSNTVIQFYRDTLWEELDYLLIDTPPGTGDITLSIYQMIPIDSVVIVSTPQDLVGLIVKKSVNMAKKMNIKIEGIVENMSYIKCPDCDKKIKLFGESNIDSTAFEMGIKVIEKIPLDPKLSSLVDAGKIEEYTFDFFKKYIDDEINGFN